MSKINKQDHHSNSKCPITRCKQITFSFASRVLGLINVRKDLQDTWKKFDINEMHAQYTKDQIFPFSDDPHNRDVFVSYALSRISVYITRQFLQDEFLSSRKQLTKEELGINNIDNAKLYASELINSVIKQIYEYFLANIDALSEANDPLIEEAKLLQMLDHQDKNTLKHFATTSGTLATIVTTVSDFCDLLLKYGYIDLSAYLEGITSNKNISFRALTNAPSMALYFGKEYPNGFLFFKNRRYKKAMDEFMAYGYPTQEFNTETYQTEWIFSPEEFEKYIKIALKKFPQLRNVGYRGCPLLYGRENSMNMITGLHAQIAHYIFTEMDKGISEAQKNPPK